MLGRIRRSRKENDDPSIHGVGSLLGNEGVSLDGESVQLPSEYDDSSLNTSNLGGTTNFKAVESADEPSESLVGVSASSSRRKGKGDKGENGEDDDSEGKARRGRGGCLPIWIASAAPWLKVLIVLSTALLVGAIVLISVAAGIGGSTRSRETGGASGAAGSGTSTASGTLAPNTFDQPSQLPSMSLSPSRKSPPPTLLPSESVPPTYFGQTFPPTEILSSLPTKVSSTSPSSFPSNTPSSSPTSAPTLTRSGEPTVDAIIAPSKSPSSTPSALPTSTPTFAPSVVPTEVPTISPSTRPTTSPTIAASSVPTVVLSTQPTAPSSSTPTSFPTTSQPVIFLSRSPSSSLNPTFTGQTYGPSQSPTSSAIVIYLTAGRPLGPQLAKYEINLPDIPVEKDSFMVNLGDWNSPSATGCDEQSYQVVTSLFSNSSVPVFFIPGDNEYNDCPDPNLAFGFWQTYLLNFETEFWPPMTFQVARQVPLYAENFAFVTRRILFVGINLVGSNIHDNNEWTNRLRANQQWIDRQITRHQDSVDLLTLFAHSDPLVSSNRVFFDGLYNRTLNNYTIRVLLVHRNIGVENSFLESNFNGVSGLDVLTVEGNIWPPMRLELNSQGVQSFDQNTWFSDLSN